MAGPWLIRKAAVRSGSIDRRSLVVGGWAASEAIRVESGPSASERVDEVNSPSFRKFFTSYALNHHLQKCYPCSRAVAHHRDNLVMASEPIKGTASYFPSIEKKYGRSIDAWLLMVRKRLPAKHMELVAILKNEHGMGHGHANALVAHAVQQMRGKPSG
uniref:DUF4287 domain-containing protein n=1 Tax=Sphingomonas bacterium TaxID=1895847 RepID=UPI0026325152|nr:DUF4287 domain-containing protein [Sphingomonas bacterium]